MTRPPLAIRLALATTILAFAAIHELPLLAVPSSPTPASAVAPAAKADASSSVLLQSQGPNLGTFSVGQLQRPLIATGGTGTFTWSVVAGSLPPGVALRTDVPSFFPSGASAGLIGVATTTGTYNFTLRVTSGAETVDQASSLKITALRPKDVQTLPDAFVGSFYSHQLTPLDAAGAVTWAQSDINFPFPPGLSLSADGIVSGIPTAAFNPGIGSAFNLSDGVDTVYHGLTLRVFTVAITTPGMLPNATQGTPYSASVSASGGTGVYSFSASGLPNGLSMSSAGGISGTTTNTGKFSVTVTATDTNNASYSKAMSVDVIGLPARLPFISPYGGAADDCTIGVPCSRGFGVYSGGTAPFTWSVTGLPTGMSFRSGDGVTTSWYSPGDVEVWGAPSALGTFNLQLTVTDANGDTASNTFPLTVSRIYQTSFLSNATLSSPYTATLRVIGGTGPYTAVQTGLPAGLTLNPSTLAISGTPLESGFFTARITYTDSASQTLRLSNSVNVNGVGQPVTINTGSDLGSTTTGSPYSRTLAACAPPFCGGSVTWSHTGGTLPPGVTLSPGGLLSGTPATSGLYTFIVRATDAANAGNFAARQMTLNVTSINISTSFSLPVGNVGSVYNQVLAATGGSGALTWTLAPLNYLPPGVTLSSGGVLSGTPTVSGLYVFAVNVADTAAQTATRTFNLAVYPAGSTPVFQSQGSSFGTYSVGSIEAALIATGGNGTFAWSVVSGSLPPGLAVRTDTPSYFSSSASAGLIGVATTPGTYSFTLRVTSGTRTADQISTLKVVALSAKDGQLPDAFVGLPYSHQLTAQGNAAAVTWTSTNTLPSGLNLSSSGLLSGTPTTAGSGSIAFSLNDGTDTVFNNVNLIRSAVNITTGGVLPNATQNAVYNTTVSASGGAGGFAFSASGLPSGLSISAGGVISGTPSSGPAKFNVQVTARDTNNVSYTKNMSLTVIGAAPALPFISPYGSNGVDDCTIGVPCSRGLGVFNGTAPFSWTASGLPPGMAARFGTGTVYWISAGDVELWGRPTTLGTYNVQLTVTDANGNTATNTFPLKVSRMLQTSFAPNGTLGTAYSAALRVIGGTGPYSGAQTGGLLSAGLSLDSTTLVLSGTPTESGSNFPRFTYTDSASQTLSLTSNFFINGAGSGGLNINSNSDLGSTTTGQSYSRTLSACCAGSITWSVIGGSLPNGVALSSTGLLSGIPSVSGIYTFLVKAEDSSNAANHAARQFTLNVASLSITTNATLPFGNIGSAYSQTLAATGGSGALTWSITPLNTFLPPGINLSAAGVLSGTPTASGQYSVTIKVTDTASQTTSRTFNISIYPAGSAPPVFQSQAANLGTWSVGSIEAQLIATGGNGTYAWSVIAGSLPPGLVIRTDKPSYFQASASAGLIGVAPTAGTYNFTLRVTSGGQTADRASTIRVVTLSTREGPLPDAFVGVPYSRQLSAQGNAAAVTWAPTGTYPNGLTLSSTGLLSGTPTAASFSSISFTLNDGTNTVSSGASISIYAVSIATAGSLPNAIDGTAYNQTITASGGSGGHTFSASGLPNGLSINTAGVISGTVSSGAGKFNVQVTARDTNNASYTKAMSINVIGVPTVLPRITPYGYNGNNGLDDCTIGVSCNRAVGVTSGGTAPYTWTATGLPPGMAVRFGSGTTVSWIAAGDAELWGKPTATGNYNVQLTVTDANGASATNAFPLRVSRILQTNSLPGGALGSPYAFTLRVTGGSGTYTAAQTAGVLAAGLTLNSNTLAVSGTPTESGNTFNPRITYTDSASETLSFTSYFVINGAGSGGITISTTADLGSTSRLSPLSRTLSACCAGSITWSQIGGSLPAGVTLSAGGVLSGTPSVAGIYTFVVQATDAANAANFAVRQFTLNVSNISISTSSLPFGNVGTAYNQTLAASGGTGALTWTSAPFNNLPPGLTLSSAGVLSGTPTASGQYSFTVQVADTAAQTASRTLTLFVYPVGGAPPLALSIGPNFTTIVGRFTVALSATGGVPPYQYSLSPGASVIPGTRVQNGAPLPTSFSASVTGGYLGVLTSPGNYTTSIRVTDAAGTTFDRAISISVVDFAIVSQTTPPKATVGVPYAFANAAFPTAGNYSWSATSLPAGLSINSSSGVISGTPTTAGTAFATVILTNVATAKSFSLAVTLVVDPFAITTGGVLPQGTGGTPYNVSFAAANCGAGCVWSSTGVPFGLSLSSNGVLSGTLLGSYNGSLSVMASGANGAVQKQFGLVIASATPSTLQISNSTPLVNTVGALVASPLFASGGTPPYATWTLQSGSLPPGVTLQSPGDTLNSALTPALTYLAGRPMAVGNYTFTLAVTDTANVTATKAFTWIVSPLNIDYFSLPLSGTTLTANAPYSQPLLVMGGTPAYSWTATSSMPAGLTLSSSGVVSGTPITAGLINTAAQVSDSSGNTNPFTLTSNIAGGRIAGRTTSAATSLALANVSVEIYNAAGSFVSGTSTDVSGNYTSGALASGNYFVRTFNTQGLIDLLHSNIPCAGCSVTSGTPIAVTSPSAVANIDFALVAGGRISGTVTDTASSTGLANITVSIYNASGSVATFANTDASGNYISRAGLPSGTYYAVTSNSLGYVNRLYNGILCVGCTPTTGTPIVVTSPATTSGIDFALSLPAVPVIASISPSGISVGAPAFTMTVNGSGFVGTSQVRINGVARTTTFVSATELRAALPASDVAAAGTPAITVVTPAPGGGTSNAAILTVAASTLTVASTTVGTGQSISVTAANGPGNLRDWVAIYCPASPTAASGYIDWNYLNGTRTAPTSPLTGATLTFTAPSTPTSCNLRFYANDAMTTLATSQTVTVEILNPVPALTALNPNSIPAGSAGFTLTVSGSGFVASSVVRVGGVARATTFVSSTQLTAVILAGDVAAQGAVGVTVVNPLPGGGTANSLTLTAGPPNPVPTLSTIAPTSVAVGTAFTLTVTGTNFVAASVVQVSGAARPTTFVSATQLTAAVPAGDVGSAGTRAITVVNPSPGGGTSNDSTLTVTGPAITPNATSVAPGGTMTFTVANGPGNPSDWVGLFCPSTGGDFPYVDWKYLSNSRTAPATGLTGAAITFTAPTGPGETCNARLFATGSVKLATSATVTVVNPVPALTALNPNALPAGSPAFTLTVTGSSFMPGSVVQVNGATRTTTFVSSTQLTAAIPAGDVSAQGSAAITVLTGAPGGGTSNSLTLTLGPPNPLPTVATIAPTSVAASGPAFTLTVNGTGFVATSAVQVNGVTRPTAFVSATQLTAAIPSGDIVSAGSRAITVVNPSPGGGTSNTATLTLTGPAVTASSNTVTPGATMTFTVANGPANALDWVGLFCPATSPDGGYTDWKYLSNSRTAPASGQSGGAVTFTAPTAPGATCNARFFVSNSSTKLATSDTVTVVNPLPALSVLNPNEIPAGSSAFTLTVTGSGFVAGSVVHVNGVARSTTFTSSTQLTAAVLAGDVATQGTAAITVVTGTPGGGTSNTLALTVGPPNPVPTTTSIAPASVAMGGPAFTLTVNGSNFVATSVVQSNGVVRPTTFVSASQLTATIPAGDTASAGARAITVFNPSPGGGTSNATTLTVTGPSVTPNATSVSPGGTMTFTVANSPGNQFDWLGLFCPATGGDFPYADWKYLSNSRTAPASGVTGAAITFTAPLAPGMTCDARLFANNGTNKLSTSVPVTVVNPTPALTALSPNALPAGSAAFTLTITGSGFVAGSVVHLNGVARTTTFMSPTQLTAAILVGDVAAQGAVAVTVVTAGPGGGSSNSLTLNVGPPNPVPATTTVAPSSVPMSSPPFTLTVNGSNFVATSVVRFNGVVRPTTFVSATQLTAAIPSSDTASSGAHLITVLNPSPGGGTSNAATFTVTGPSVTPNATSVAPGGTMTFTVADGPGNASDWIALVCPATGGDFPYADWKYLSNTRTAPGTGQTGAAITFTAPTATGATCNARLFFNNGSTRLATSATVTVVNPLPALTALSPNAIPATSAAFTMTVNGSGFVAGSVVHVNASARTTTFVSPTQLTVSILAADVAVEGIAAVTVVTGAPGGGTSNSLPLNVGPPNPVPTVGSIAPTSVAMGTPAFTLTVNGSFVATSSVRVNGIARTTTFVSATQLTAVLPAGDAASTGTRNITVVNPAPGGGTSNSATLTVTGPTLTAGAITVAPGGTMTFNVADGLGNVLDWVALFCPATSPDGSYVDWRYLNNAKTAPVAGVTVATVTFTAPTTPGATCEARLFANNSLTRLSTSETVTVLNPLPALTAVNPNALPAGSAAFTLVATGSGFTTGSVVHVNGVARTTTFVSSTQLTAAILAGDVAAQGAVAVTVVTGAPGGGTSNSLTLTVGPPNPVPVVGTIAPTSVAAAGPTFTLTVNGSNFVATSVVLVNGVARPTTFVSATQLTAAIPPGDTATGGTRTITVFNPSPGGGTSNTATLTVTGPAQAALVSPAPGSTLTAASATFQWTAGTSVADYWIYVGTTGAGSLNLYSASQGTSLSRVISGLPTNGTTIYVRMWSLLPAPLGWQFTDYTLTAATIVPTKAELASPTPGSTLTGGNATFQWTTGTAVTGYWLYVGTTGAGSRNLYDASEGTGLSRAVSGLPTSGTIFVRLWSLLPTGWQFTDYTFTGAAGSIADADAHLNADHLVAAMRR